MIKKRFILILCVLLLCGCSKLSTKSVNKDVYDILINIPLSEDIAPNTHSKDFYSYYLPNDMGIIASSQSSSILQKDGFKIIMNFNVSSIIISEYYTNLSDGQEQQNITVKQYTEESLKKLIESGQLINKDENKGNIVDNIQNKEIDTKLYSSEKDGISYYKGVFYNRDKEPYTFQLKTMQVGNDYYIYLDGTIASFTTVVPYPEVDNVVNSMLHILKSIDYDKDEILKQYSLQYDLKTMQDKFKKNQDYVYRNFNTDGYLEDLINDENLEEFQ